MNPKGKLYLLFGFPETTFITLTMETLEKCVVFLTEHSLRIAIRTHYLVWNNLKISFTSA